MSSYIKIPYIAANPNNALKECIIFIGRYYGENERNPYKKGLRYVAQKCRTSKTAIRNMIYAYSIKGFVANQWRFKKKSYAKAYEYIVNVMVHDSTGHRKEAEKLLQKLCKNTKGKIKDKVKISDVLILQQREMLENAEGMDSYVQEKEDIGNILKIIAICDSENRI